MGEPDSYCNGEVRMCTGMRQANKAIVRERCPIPTVQEMLVEMNGATVFFKVGPQARVFSV